MSELALFDADPYTIPAVEPGEKLSAGRKLTLRQAADLAKGIHPLTGGKLHPDAAPAGDRSAPGTRCGTCRFRVSSTYHGRGYPKCHYPDPEEFRIANLPRVTHGPATDCRGWWPACTSWKPREAS